MELLQQHSILKLKSLLFELLEFGEGLLNFDFLLDQVLSSLQLLLDASDVTLYSWSDRSQQLHIEASTSLNPILSPFLSNMELTGLLLSRNIMRRPIPIPSFNKIDLLLPLRKDITPIGLITVKGKVTRDYSEVDDELLKELCQACSLFLYNAREYLNVISEEKRYKQLFRVTEKFHSSMNMEAVLGEIIHTLREIYPTFTYYLLLSHDNNSKSDLPIKDLEYDSENIAAMQAYVTGKTQFEDSSPEDDSILYAPLKGKQGVYGVLQVISPNTTTFPENEVEFITLLAKNAGSALENAQLYQQSRRLISDLQLINETSHRLNSNLRITDTMTFMKEQIINSFDAEEVGFILLSDCGQTKVLDGSTTFFNSDRAADYLSYFKDKFLNEKESLFIGDFHLGENETVILFKSIMAVPMIQTGMIEGFSLVMHREPYHFPFETFKLLQSLIHHSTLALSNSLLREELEKMVVIDHLTKLYSRKYLDEKIHASMKHDNQGAFILIDIDNFKAINDTHGHQVGDIVLVQVANIIRQNIRDTDIGTRWGGEELAIYLPQVPLEVGFSIAERLVQKVKEYTKPTVTISCGIAAWKNEISDTYTGLFKRADQALYKAKETGKNKVVIQDSQ